METAPAPKFTTIDGWLKLSGMGRRAVYDAMGRGDLRGVKCGSRTLIDCEAGLAWLNSLPPATIRPPRERQRAAA
jgi:hypothetical protein